MLFLIRIGFALIGFVLRLVPSLTGAPAMIMTPTGSPYGLKHKRGFSDSGPKTEIWIPFPGEVRFRLEEETSWTRFCKAIGFGRETTLSGSGGGEFDRLFYISSDHSAFLEKLKSDLQLQEVFLRLRKAGAVKLRCDDGRFLRLSFNVSIEKLDPVLQRDLDLLYKKLGEIRTAMFDLDSHFVTFVILEAVIYAVAGYAVANFATYVIYHPVIHLEPELILGLGLLLAFALLAAWIIVIYVLMRNSARAPFIVTELFLVALFSLLVAGPGLVADLNRLLDRSLPMKFQAGITKSFERVTRTSSFRLKYSLLGRMTARESESVSYFLNLKFVSNPLGIPSEYEVTWDRNRFAENLGIEFEVRNGFLGIPYISRTNAIPFPKALETSVIVTAVKYKEHKDFVARTILENSNWRSKNTSAANLPGLLISEFKDHQGNIRGRETFVNGIKEGRSKYYHPNGHFQMDIDWKKGVPHGSYKVYRSNGSLEQWTSYKDGKPHGLFAWFGVNGLKDEPSHLAIYYEGKVIERDRDHLMLLYRELMLPHFPGF